jgi:hypothetical protein
MTINGNAHSQEYPPRGDLRAMMDELPLPTLAPGLVDPELMAGDAATKQANIVLSRFNAALASNDATELESCFYADQAFWKDQLALTYHLRTFQSPSIIAESLLKTEKLRGVSKGIAVDGAALFLPATPVLQFIDCPIVFRTESPGASCRGKILFLPVKTEQDGHETLEWKIWVLSTRLEALDIQAEDETLLETAPRQLDDLDLETEVFIVGGGNAAAALSARLKALGVDCVMAERNPKPGDNWALRYDCMRFHIPTSFCDLPYMCYDKELQTPHLLSRSDLASQVSRYIETFNLNIINSAKIQSTHYDPSTERWHIKFQTPAGQRSAVSKHLVLATGIGSQKPNIPDIADKDLYQGITIHSAQYQNAKVLAEKGAKTALVIGSANTAFDVLEDCQAAGLKTTMNVRSPTYIVPVDYVCHKMSLGAYDFGVEAADNLFLSLPSSIDGQLARGLFAVFASQEPKRYAALEAAGFPVLDSSHPTSALMHNLIEKAGGHYVDVGGTKLIEEGKVGVKAGVEPVAYTATGLRFSDGSALDADAIVWCTGFSDGNLRNTAAEILGGSSEPNGTVNGTINGDSKHLLGPQELAERVDSTWGIDSEGEIRGMWKRHLRLDNFWVMGGYTQQHRWHSRTLALQIKAALAGVLPPAYRDTPTVKTK